MKIFHIPKGSYTPELVPEFYEIECFKEIRHRLRKCEGDSDGRKKVLNFKELSYIHFMTDHASKHSMLEDEDRDESVKIELGMPKGWKADETVQQCIEMIKEEYVRTEGYEAYDTLRNLLKWQRKYIREKTTEDNLRRLTPKQAGELQDLGLEIPKLIEAVNTAKINLDRQLEAGSKGRKGRSINHFELTAPEL